MNEETIMTFGELRIDADCMSNTALTELKTALLITAKLTPNITAKRIIEASAHRLETELERRREE